MASLVVSSAHGQSFKRHTTLKTQTLSLHKPGTEIKSDVANNVVVCLLTVTTTNQASLQPCSGLFLCSHFLPPLCCAAVCLLVSPSVCLSLSARLKPAGVYLHSSSTFIFMMEAGHSTRRCVGVQDLIGLWSEGILHGESQVEREQGPHCSELHFLLSLPSPPPEHKDSAVVSAQVAFSSQQISV